MKVQVTYGGSLKGHNLWLLILTLALLSLWIPVLYEKITDFGFFQRAMLRQYFPLWFKYILMGMIPVAEAILVVLLLNARTNLYGMYLSFTLMLSFTGYVGLALWLKWVKIPCGCMKVINAMSWETHFYFNLFFLFLSGTGILLSRKQRSIASRAGGAEGVSAKRQIKTKHS